MAKKQKPDAGKKAMLNEAKKYNLAEGKPAPKIKKAKRVNKRGGGFVRANNS